MRPDELTEPSAGPGAPPPGDGRERSYYKVLGVDSEAEDFIIDAAYRALMRRHHPDRGGETWRAQAINEAYTVLRSPAARLRYDRALEREAADGSVMTAGPPRPELARRRARLQAALLSHVYMALAMLLLISGLVAARRSLGIEAAAAPADAARPLEGRTAMAGSPSEPIAWWGELGPVANTPSR